MERPEIRAALETEELSGETFMLFEHLGRGPDAQDFRALRKGAGITGQRARLYLDRLVDAGWVSKTFECFCTGKPIGRGIGRSNHDPSLLFIEVLLGWVSSSDQFVKAFETSTVVR